RSELAELQNLYRASGYAPLWFDAGGVANANVRDSLALLDDAPSDGLEPSDYFANQLGQLAVSLEAVSPSADPDLYACFDVALTAGMLRYLHDLHAGRIDPRAIGLRLSPSDEQDYAAVLRSAVREHRMTETAAALRPPLAEYRVLRTVLLRYRALLSD